MGPNSNEALPPNPAGEDAVQPPALAPFSVPLPAASSNTGQPAVATPVNPASVQDDDDIIEKDWINKAKQIIAQTKGDPYKQSEELTLFKADYMKKRHNKTVKVK